MDQTRFFPELVCSSPTFACEVVVAEVRLQAGRSLCGSFPPFILYGCVERAYILYTPTNSTNKSLSEAGCWRISKTCVISKRLGSRVLQLSPANA